MFVTEEYLRFSQKVFYGDQLKETTGICCHKWSAPIAQDVCENWLVGDLERFTSTHRTLGTIVGFVVGNHTRRGLTEQDIGEIFMNALASDFKFEDAVTMEAKFPRGLDKFSCPDEHGRLLNLETPRRKLCFAKAALWYEVMCFLLLKRYDQLLPEQQAA